jgi:hypothetical protein
MGQQQQQWSPWQQHWQFHARLLEAGADLSGRRLVQGALPGSKLLLQQGLRLHCCCEAEDDSLPVFRGNTMHQQQQQQFQALLRGSHH